MEASAGVATGCRVSSPMPSSQSSRKEWTAASNSSTEDVERSKMGQSDERTMHEQGTGPLDVDFCSIIIDGSSNSNNDLLHQRLHGVSRQREELQQMEIELRAQIIARAEMLEMQKSFDTQIKEHANAAAKLKEKLQERDQCILDLERKMEEADRELRAIKFDNEAAWAKDDLLREQDKELATFRRERHNSEAERAQHLKQIHDLNEHINKKESQILEFEEQHKAAQETILYKDEQLREAQAWVARAQDMDALQSTTNHSLQAELRERTEQFNQFWLGCQRQFAEMERHNFQTIQQLQLELAEARKGNGFSGDEAQTGHANSKDASADNGNQISVKEGGTFNGNSENLPNSNIDCIAPVPVGNASTQIDHVPGVLTVPSSLPGMDAFLPPGQMTGLHPHPFVMYQQGLHHFVPSANSHMPQSHVSHFHTVPAIQPHQHWPNQQVVSENPQIPNQNQCQLSQTEQSVLKSDANSVFDLPGDGQIVHSDYLGADISPLQPSGPVITSSSKEAQVLVSNDKQFVSSPKPHQTIQENSSQFHNTLRLDPLQLKTDPKVSLENSVLNSSDKSSESESAGLSFRQRNDENAVGLISQSREKLGLSSQLPLSVATESAANHRGDSTDANKYNPSGAVLCDTPISAGQTSNTLAVLGRSPQPAILDERSLLACIVRAVPPVSGGQIRISTTLPNRLGKMLAPFHWHDYRKQYGKLDEFVARHPELFVIEGDFIHLREGAQEIISATTAAAKVAAAAAAVTAPYSSVFPSVAVTPVAQPHRLKQVPSANNPSYSPEKQMQYQQSNGISYNIAQGLSNVKVTGKSKDILKLNGLSSKVKSVHLAAGNGSNNGRTGLPMVQSKESNNGSQGLNYGGKQQGRGTGDALTPRRY